MLQRLSKNEEEEGEKEVRRGEDGSDHGRAGYNGGRNKEWIAEVKSEQEIEIMRYDRS